MASPILTRTRAMTADVLALLVPIIAIAFGISAGIIALYLDFRRKTEALKLYHAERMAAIEKGIELPPLPQMAQPPREAEPAHVRSRRNGLILLVIGLSTVAAMWQMGLGRVGWWGLLPAGIGLALLISSVLDAREREREKAGKSSGQDSLGKPDL